MSASEGYVCDANSLFNLKDHYPGEAKKLRRAINQRIVKLPEGVVREVQKGTDRLTRHFRSWNVDQRFAIQLSDPVLKAEWNRINQAYGKEIVVGKKTYDGFWKTPSGKRSVDAQLIAVAKFYGNTVVSDDTAVRMACLLEDVPCIG